MKILYELVTVIEESLANMSLRDKPCGKAAKGATTLKPGDLPLRGTGIRAE